MAVTFKAVQDAMIDHNAVVWSVKGRSGQLLGYQKDQDIDVDTSISRLKNLLMETRAEICRVEIQPKPSKSNKGGDMMKIMKMDVDLASLKQSQAVAGIPSVPADFGKFESILNKLQEQNAELHRELIKTKYEGKIAELEKKIEGISNEQPEDPIGRVLDLVIPILSNYIPKMMAPKNPDINGTDPVSRLIAADPSEGAKVIEAIAILAETRPEVYQQYKPILLGMI